MFQSKRGGLQIKVDNRADTSANNNNNNNNNGNPQQNINSIAPTGNNNIVDEKSTFSLYVITYQSISLDQTNSGTFREGDLAINKKGLLICGESPKNSPLNFVDRKRPIIQRSYNNYQQQQQQQTNEQQQNNNNNNYTTTTTNNIMSNQPQYENILSLELKDLKIIKILGRGEGGVVKLAYHESSKTSIALKVIPLDVQENIRKQIILELKTLHRTHCPYIVSFYDAFYTEGSIHIALEYMEGGSLSDLMKLIRGPIPENILGRITFQVLEGLHYLHRQLHLIHRDIKPSNILINKLGQAKISDFGVSSQRQDTLSKAVTWVGTVVYMSPERISGMSYSYDSDIWSLGLTLLECALGYFPYSPPKSANTDDSGIGFWTLMDTIVKTPVPTLPIDKYSKEFCSFISDCLQKEPEERPSSSKILNHPFIKKYKDEKADEWIASQLKQHQSS
ncbi:MAP kinase kinase [Cavenderia fasciculata]|uniref:mitogen-activated protein kinase kinase n=1 Tax=Cavenderia fasciculata TaxID=261658 RepID=F4Q9D4_CACFS|nr:MAP kinase kinase [Cavenderia fasciculata]EGG15303.1 MAP kinase kinase [Cavenderia fasciculata]|eukprot:XP_004352023.1 MAP kinase kinase [Cavenderia fasciculata]